MPEAAPDSPPIDEAAGGDFLADLVRVQCRIAPAEAGAMVRLSGGSAAQVVAAHPRLNGRPPDWLSAALRSAGDQPASIISVPTAIGDRAVALLRLAGDPKQGGELGYGAYLLPSGADDSEAALALERLGISGSLVELFGLRHRAASQAGELARRRRLLECVAAVGEHDALAPAVFALVNHAASVFACERAALGLACGGVIRLEAMSHAEKIVRATDAARRLEAAMEECLDQDEEIIHPEPPGSGAICRAVRELAARSSGSAMSVPLRSGGVPFGVLTLERASPFNQEDVEDARLLADLVAGPIALLDRRGRSLGAMLLIELRRAAAAIVGPRHTGKKLLAIGIVALLFFGALATGERRVPAPFRLESAPEGGLRAVLYVPERDAARVAAGQRAAMLAPARPGERFACEIQEVGSAAERLDGRVVLPCRARLVAPPEWLREGFAGEARVTVGRERYLSVWFGPLVDRVRAALWL